MSGWANGVQAKIRKLSPSALYIHCHAHRLNLVLVDTMRSDPGMSELFDTVQQLYNFFSNSTPRHEIFVEAQKSLNQKVLELERTVATRWFYFHRSILKVKSRFEAIVVALDVVANGPNKDNCVDIAIGLKRRILSFRFIGCMFLAEEILAKTNCLSQQLQSASLILSAASSLIRSTNSDLENMKDSEESFKCIYVNATDFVKKFDVNSATNPDSSDENPTSMSERSKRVREISSRLKDYFVDSPKAHQKTSSDNPEASFKNDTYIPVLEKVIREFDRRLGSRTELIGSLACFEPGSSKFMDFELVSCIASNYSNLFTDSELEALQNQTSTAKRLLETSAVSCVHDIVKILVTLPAAFDQLLKLLTISITLPVSSASSERFFSTLKRVKTYIRATMGGDRLSNLMIISVEAEFVKKIDPNLLVDMFGKRRERRYPVLL